MIQTQNCVPHGRMECSRCWIKITADAQEAGPFRLVRDPGHWGSANPSTLILGLSKGNTQSTAFASDYFDEVAFKKIRHRLLEVLQSVGLLPGEKLTRFETRFTSAETEYAFASVIRCSLTGYDRKKGRHTADSPNVIPALREGSPGWTFANNCVSQHIGRLPAATRLVILLGNTSGYMKNLRQLISNALGGTVSVNEVAYRAGGALFVHVTHPSRGNGYFNAFVESQGTSGAKRMLALQALQGYSEVEK